jgi:hypothetical protein
VVPNVVIEQAARDGYRIQLQRVDMTNAQAAFDYVLQVWV